MPYASSSASAERSPRPALCEQCGCGRRQTPAEKTSAVHICQPNSVHRSLRTLCSHRSDERGDQRRHFTPQGATLGLEEHRDIVRMPLQFHSTDLAIRDRGAVARRFSPNRSRFVFPIEAVAAVVALGDSRRPVSRANPPAVRQQNLVRSAPPASRPAAQSGALPRRDLSRHAPPPACRGRFARTRAGHAGSRRTCPGTGGAVPARSVWHRSRPRCSHTGSPARTRFRRSRQAGGPASVMELVWIQVPSTLRPVMRAGQLQRLGDRLVSDHGRVEIADQRHTDFASHHEPV